MEPIQFVDLHAQRQRIAGHVDAAIAKVLSHGKYIMGPEVSELESRLSAYTGAPHVITCSSGTDALLMVLMAHDVGPGDAVICPDFTYTATPESIALLGATPIFVDVDSASFSLAPEHLDAAVAKAAEARLNLRGLIAVDLFGLPADYLKINRWAKERGLFVLGDGAQSFGASVEGRRVGTLTPVTATSFFPAKPLGCYGDGGAVLTKDADMADVLRSIRAHGKRTGGGKYDIARIGLNGRLDTLQAAILIEKLRIYDAEHARREAIAQGYTSSICSVFDPPEVPSGRSSAWAQYTIKAPDGQRDALRDHLAEQGIPTAIYYPRPLHQQTAYRSFPTVLHGSPVSQQLSRNVLSLPIHPYLSDEQQCRICAAVNSFNTKE